MALLTLLCVLTMLKFSYMASASKNNISLTHSIEPKNITDLYLLGLWAMTGPWPGGYGILPAALMAMEHINKDPSMLPGYRLNMIWNDSAVIYSII